MNTSSVTLNTSVDAVVSIVGKSLPELRKLCVEAGYDKTEVSKWNKEFCVGMLLKQYEQEASTESQPEPELTDIPLVLRPESEALRRHIINQGSFRLIDRTVNGVTKVYGCLRFSRSDWKNQNNRLAIQMFLSTYCTVVETTTDEKTGFGQVVVFSSIKMYESLHAHCQMPLFPEWMTIRIQQEAERQAKLWGLLRKRQEGAAEWAARKEELKSRPDYRPVKRGTQVASSVNDETIPDPWVEETNTVVTQVNNVATVADYDAVPF